MMFWTMVGAGQIEGINGFTRLEVDIGILGGAAEDRAVGGEGAGAMGVDQFLFDEGAHVVLGELFDFGDLMGGAESIEEVLEGDARFESGGLGDEGKIHHFLDGIGRQHGEAGGAGGHDVAVIAEDG